jgi:hypothetical protein
MSIDLTAVNHACNVVRRSVQEEFTNLSVLFYVHKTGEREKLVKARMSELMQHPAGRYFGKKFRESAEEDREISRFLGVARFREKKLLPFMGKDKFLAVFFINTDFFQDSEDISRFAWSLIYRALRLMEDYKNRREDDFIEKDNVIEDTLKPSETSKINMLADAFSAIILELQGQKGTIIKLARKRSLMALNKSPGYKAEEFPFPIALDAAQIVYDEYVPAPNLRGRLAHQALEMVHEIGLTFDESTIRQWWVFSRSAQEMAWMNVDKNIILSAAIYTSEDPFVRSTAYIVAEVLSVEPSPPSDIDFYNSFADQEVNERHHFRICDEIFQELATRTVTEGDPIYFKKVAIDQNKALLDGKLVGWCSYALLKAFEVFRNERENMPVVVDKAKKVFYEASRSIPWDRLIEFNNLIIRYRIHGAKLTLQRLHTIAGKDETFQKLSEAFALNLKQENIILPGEQTVPAPKDDEQEHRDITEYFSDGGKKTGLKLEDDGTPRVIIGKT